MADFKGQDKVRAKKHLGQHFLKDERTAERIVMSYFEKASEVPLLEVGPGMGVLTKYILEKQPVNFFALDVDEESVAFLKSNYPAHATKFLFADFLKIDLKKVVDGKFNVIGNFPYNISSQIMFRVLEYRNEIDCVVGMFQKEVAQRIASPPGPKEYGILSVLLQAFYKIEYLFTVSPGVFQPQPKVKSGVIRLTRNDVKKLDCDEVLYFKVVKTSFNQRRKTLRNALKPLLQGKVFEHELLDKRAEQLGVREFLELTKMIEEI
jgi:16S rRNA (adenine1518-N6/adenine1519-N6)-dimethyltransferase